MAKYTRRNPVNRKGNNRFQQYKVGINESHFANVNYFDENIQEQLTMRSHLTCSICLEVLPNRYFKPTHCISKDRWRKK